MAEPRQPQDRKPKQTRPKAAAIAAEKPGAFTFEHDGETHELPHAGAYAHLVDGGALMDAMLFPQPEIGELQLALKMLKAASEDMTPEAFAALRAKPSDEFSRTVAEWMKAGGTASPGES